VKQAIWTERYEVGSFLVDFNKKLSLHGLMSLLQETAWCHADHLGHGYAQTDKRGAAWVLIRQRVEMEIWPGWRHAECAHLAAPSRSRRGDSRLRVAGR
jgi:medium-chain acyl-[acyl-carrier-protein] hydrolase